MCATQAFAGATQRICLVLVFFFKFFISPCRKFLNIFFLVIYLTTLDNNYKYYYYYLQTFCPK